MPKQKGFTGLYRMQTRIGKAERIRAENEIKSSSREARPIPTLPKPSKTSKPVTVSYKRRKKIVATHVHDSTLSSLARVLTDSSLDDVLGSEGLDTNEENDV